MTIKNCLVFFVCSLVLVSMVFHCEKPKGGPGTGCGEDYYEPCDTGLVCCDEYDDMPGLFYHCRYEVDCNSKGYFDPIENPTNLHGPPVKGTIRDVPTISAVSPSNDFFLGLTSSVESWKINNNELAPFPYHYISGIYLWDHFMDDYTIESRTSEIGQAYGKVFSELKPAYGTGPRGEYTSDILEPSYDSSEKKLIFNAYYNIDSSKERADLTTYTFNTCVSNGEKIYPFSFKRSGTGNSLVGTFTGSFEAVSKTVYYDDGISTDPLCCEPVPWKQWDSEILEFNCECNYSIEFKDDYTWEFEKTTICGESDKPDSTYHNYQSLDKSCGWWKIDEEGVLEYDAGNYYYDKDGITNFLYTGDYLGLGYHFEEND